MPLWGKTTADESKPKYLKRGSKVAEPDNCFATNQGWVYRHYKNAAKTEYYDEVLVAIGGLAGAQGEVAPQTTNIGEATITAVFFEESAYAGAATGSIVVVYNEKVTVSTAGGAPTITVTAGAGTATATYARGSSTNRLEFDFTVAATGTTHSIAAQSIALNGGTIYDAGTTNAADVTIVAGDVTGAGGTGTTKTFVST